MELDNLSILFPWFPELPHMKSVALAQYILLCVNINSYSSKLDLLQKIIDTNKRRFNSIQYPKVRGLLRYALYF